jgi:hypothetical protein
LLRTEKPNISFDYAEKSGRGEVFGDCAPTKIRRIRKWLQILLFMQYRKQRDEDVNVWVLGGLV